MVNYSLQFAAEDDWNDVTIALLLLWLVGGGNWQPILALLLESLNPLLVISPTTMIV